MILAFVPVFIVYRIVSYIFERLLIQAQRNRSERFKIISVYINKAICSYRRYLWQIATAAFNHTHLAWDSDTRIGIISSSATESKRIIRPGGAGPTFELCRIFFKIQNKTVNFLEPKVYTIKKATSSNRKIATNCDSGI